MKNKLLLLAMGIALSAQTLMAQVPSYVPTDGLVGYWPFSGNANDVGFNGNNGTNNGANLIIDRFGNASSAYELSTLTDNLTVDNVQPAFDNNVLSISLWMKFPTQYNQSSLALVKNGTPYTNGFDVAIDQNDTAYGVNNYLVVFLVGSGTPVSFIANQSELGVWSNIVSTYDGNNIKIYLNGILKATQAFNQSMNIPNNNLVFGSWDNPTTPEVKTRQIDDIGIWNRALTQQEITTMYNGIEVPNYSDTCNNVSGSLTQGLVGYWPFCGNANDDSGNGNNGTVNGASLTTDRFGNASSAYSFDGVNDIITASASNFPIGTSSRTVSFWYQLNSFNQTNDQKVMIGYGGGTPCSDWTSTIWPTTNFPSLDINFNYVVYSNPLQLGSWYHYIVTYELFNGTNVLAPKVYINGVLQTGVDLVNNTCSINTANSIGLVIGGGSSGNANMFFNGKIDDIGIWNRALMSQEIINLYNANQCFNLITVTDTLIINVGQLSYNNPVTYSNNITIAPNPASTQININFNNITDLNGGTLKVINSLGQEVATTPITTSGTQSIMQLATWGGSGMYFVQIINPQGQIVDIKKIILQ